jgi:hypothetical protein
MQFYSCLFPFLNNTIAMQSMGVVGQKREEKFMMGFVDSQFKQ